MPDSPDLMQSRGQKMVDGSSNKIGTIEELYLDNDTGKPEWALVNTGMFGSKSSFVPLTQASMSGGNVVVPYEKARVTDAPQLEHGQELSQDQESELYRHYGLDYGESRSDSGLPEGGMTGERPQHTGGRGPVGNDLSGPETDEAMTRSEEQLHVGTQSRESGRARLRKHVVTEQVEQSVPVSREQVRVTREPITADNVDLANAGPELSEEEHEVTLHEEIATVDKHVVPQERVRMDRETVTGEQQVSEEVRKEQIEVDDSDAPSRR